MTMKKLVLLLCLALSLVLATAGLADEVPAGLIGEWEMTGTEGMDYWDEDESAGIIFTETTMTMLEDGEGYDMPYTVNGEYIVANGVSVRYVLDGDTFKMYNGNEGLIFTRKGAAPDASVLLGEWKLVGPVDEATAAQMPEDYEVSFVFTETEIISTAIINGEDNSQSAEYTVEGNKILSDVSEMTWEINGNELILTEFGVSLRFERVSNGIVGEWDVVEFIGQEEAAQGMEVIKAMGGSVKVIFTETEMTLRMSFMGENMDETTTYTIVGNEIVADGEGVPFVLEGNRLTISDGETGFVLVRAGTEAEATEAEAVETPSKTGVTSPIGEWTLVAMTGSEEAEQSWQIVKAVGGSITLTVTENTALLTMTLMGQSETEETPCTVNGNVVTLEGGSTIVLENDQLILTEDGMSMVFEQK